MLDAPDETACERTTRMQSEHAAALLDERLGSMRSRSGKSKQRSSKQAVARAEVEIVEMRRTGDWSSARPMHFVALYAWLHREIYGVEALDLLQNDAAYAAASAAGKLQREDFGGDARAVVEFLAWCWARERQRRRRANGGGDGAWRISWRLQFCSRALLTDWRVATMGR